MNDQVTIDYKRLFESCPDYYIVLKADPPDFTIVTMTDSFLRTSMKSRSELLGKRLFEVFPINPEELGADGSRNLATSLNRVIKNKIPNSMAVQKYDIKKPSSEGAGYEERYWSTSNYPILENGEVIYIIHRTEDVTELIKAKGQMPGRERLEYLESEIILRAKQIQESNEKLHAAIQLREDVLAIVSHDLKNPLGSIEMCSELLKDNLADNIDSESITFLEIIDRSVKHMKRLIGDLLSFAKIQSGNLTVEMERTSLERLINESIESVQHQAFKKKIIIKKEFNSKTPEIYCDHDRILEVISNILGNAIKFSPAHDSIVFSVNETGDEILFSIKDNGPGIAREHMPHLFDRYWQAKETAKQGTGLGLAIAKGIITSHEGKIWADSVLGQGTTMNFSIPIDHLQKKTPPANLAELR